MEATFQEAARIIGYENEFVEVSVLKKLRVGSVIDINGMWRPLSAMGNREAVIKKLRDASDACKYGIEMAQQTAERQIQFYAKYAKESLETADREARATAEDLDFEPTPITEPDDDPAASAFMQEAQPKEEEK